ncbi:hypothetical protein ElyMa_005592700 [Elysia marginata]|uniref:Uncharacterized protein n=1 Tax=Elysia marginata TaxID=1093978 RepID=A0AAV4F5U9_9GAST|nr:hypothetical protein ElyMa_005592700 [Elysia marginata]
MLMGARPNSRRQTHLNHQDPHPAAHGSHLTANKNLASIDRIKSRGHIDARDFNADIFLKCLADNHLCVHTTSAVLLFGRNPL